MDAFFKCEVKGKGACLPDGRLRLSSLFKLLEDAASEHVALLGCGREKLAATGLLWVITCSAAEIKRMPQEGEKLQISTWTGRRRFFLMPRFYLVEDMMGDILVTARSDWTVMDAVTRRFALKNGVIMPTAVSEAGPELSAPVFPHGGDYGFAEDFTVIPEVCDSNGHMNNCRYFDLAENLLLKEIPGARPCNAAVRYRSEAPLGTVIRLEKSLSEGTLLLKGSHRSSCFDALIDYFTEGKQYE